VPLAATAELACRVNSVSAALLLYNSIHTFKSAKDVLVKDAPGVDVLDSIVVVACLATVNVFAGSVLCWCLSFGRMLVREPKTTPRKCC